MRAASGKGTARKHFFPMKRRKMGWKKKELNEIEKNRRVAWVKKRKNWRKNWVCRPLWSRITKNQGVITRRLADPFALSLAELIHSFACRAHSFIRSQSSFIHLLARAHLFAHSLTCLLPSLRKSEWLYGYFFCVFFCFVP